MPPKPISSLSSLLIVGVIVIITWLVHVAGIYQDLPYFVEHDEVFFTSLVVTMLQDHTLNPGWYGHPGSTYIYPLLLTSWLWQIITPETSGLFNTAQFAKQFADVWTEYYLIGRFLSVFYAVVSIPVIYLLGKKAFGQRTGIMAVFLFALYPLSINYAQMVRTDSSTVFWGTLSLWLCLRVYEQPTTRNQVFAGSAIGLAIASKYYLVPLVLILITIDIINFGKKTTHTTTLKKQLVTAIIGLLSILTMFFLSTPYFFLDSATTYNSLQKTSHSSHPGIENLSPWGNLFWYLGQAIPSTLPWLQTFCLISGIILILFQRKTKQLLILEFVVAFLIFISLSGLHWQRWIIPILPMLAIFVAHAFDTIFTWIIIQFKVNRVIEYGLLITIGLIFSLPNISTLISSYQNQNLAHTRLIAGIWLRENLPSGSKILIEEDSAVLGKHNFEAQQFFSLGELGELGLTLDDAYQYGFDYVIVSSLKYDRYIENPTRYPNQVEAYQSLFENTTLIQEFQPSSTVRGNTIRVYTLDK